MLREKRPDVTRTWPAHHKIHAGITVCSSYRLYPRNNRLPYPLPGNASQEHVFCSFNACGQVEKRTIGPEKLLP